MDEFDKVNTEWQRLNSKLSNSSVAVKITIFLLTPFIAVAMIVAFIYGAYQGIRGE